MISIVLKILTATSMIYRVRIQCMSEQFPHMAPSMIPEAELGLKSSPDYQFIYGSNLDATPAIANFWRAFEKAQSDSIPMKLHGSFLGQGRPFFKPSHGYASPPCRFTGQRGLKRGGQQFQGFRDDVSTHSWQQTSQLQASYIIYHLYIHTYIHTHIYIYIYDTPYIFTYSHTLYIYHSSTHRPNQKPQRDLLGPGEGPATGAAAPTDVVGNESPIRWDARWNIWYTVSRFMWYPEMLYIIDCAWYTHTHTHTHIYIYIYICTYMPLISLTLFYLTYLL